MSYEKTTITGVLNKIHNSELILPDIQRDFVWDEERIYNLLDSILRGYPFGTLLFWNTTQRLQYRAFTKDWAGEQGYAFQIKLEGQRGTVVLDGQQRLQSLYLSLMGTFKGKVLHFDLLSGRDSGDLSDLKYVCEFLPAGEAQRRNQKEAGRHYWVPLRDLSRITGPELLGLRSNQYCAWAGVDVASADGERLSANVSRVFWCFRSSEVLNYYTIDGEYGADGVVTPLNEVLEIFVRINSGGEVLSKSDLMFSLMQLHWSDAASAIAELTDDLNEKGRFEFDRDFILKCALACCGKGARYDVDKLRDEGTVAAIREAFPRLAAAVVACVDLLVNTAKISDGRVLSSYNALIPFVYYLYLQPRQTPASEADLVRMNQALYLTLMTRVLGRYADSRIDVIASRVIDPAHREMPGIFPLRALRDIVKYYEGHDRIDDALLQVNVPLLMNILEGGSKLPEGQRHHRPEYDHIFPHSKLREYGYSEEQANHYANFRLISQRHNNWKRAQDPKPYFEANPEVMGQYLIPEDYLEYDQYLQFLEARRALIWQRVRNFLGCSAEQPTADAEAVPATPSAMTAQPATRPVEPTPAHTGDRLADMRHVLSYRPVSEGQRRLYRALYEAGDAGLTSAELYSALGLTGVQAGGLIAALSKRVNSALGLRGAAAIGSGLFIGGEADGQQWRYRLCPEFRAALDADPDLRRLALGPE